MERALESADHGSGKRRYWSIEEKRRIVEETLCSSASVASLAREHGLNANQLFYWRKQYHAGQLVPSAHVGSSSDVRLLPVTVADEASHQAQGDAGPSSPAIRRINLSDSSICLCRYCISSRSWICSPFTECASAGYRVVRR